jgi:hypothetical protein
MEDDIIPFLQLVGTPGPFSCSSYAQAQVLALQSLLLFYSVLTIKRTKEQKLKNDYLYITCFKYSCSTAIL